MNAKQQQNELLAQHDDLLIAALEGGDNELIAYNRFVVAHGQILHDYAMTKGVIVS